MSEPRLDPPPPPSRGDPLDLPRLRQLLLAAGYERTASIPAFSSRTIKPWLNRTVARRLEQGQPLPLACHSHPSRYLNGLPAPLQRLYRVLYLHDQVPIEGMEELIELGLLETVDDSLCQSRLQVTALPHPGGTRFILSSVPGRTPGPFVYLGDDSGHLIEAARDIPADGRALDICCGCGVVGLCLPTGYSEVRGLDANASAIELARWNAILNGECVQGAAVSFDESDLWSAADGRYQLVIGNPPALPLTDTHPDLQFARGGQRPTELTCKTVEGLHRHLAPGGRCILLSFSVDGQLWDDLLPLLDPGWSLRWRVRDSHPLPGGKWLHHVWLDIRHDGRRERLRQGPSWSQRLLNFGWPFSRAEKPAQKNYMRFGGSR